MAEKEFVFTDEQKSAISYRGGALLVSAAAGSGKTKVLVERLLARIDEGDDIDEFLVITFTRAAASELRERIQNELSDRLAENPGDRRLYRQSVLCRTAAIGTIHSFCADILRQYAHLAGVSPDFRVLEENESKIIKSTVLENVLNEAYENAETGGSFYTLVDAVSNSRDDKPLFGMILDAHSRLRTDSNPSGWVKKQTGAYNDAISSAADISETEWGKYLLHEARRKAEHWYREFAQLRDDARDCPDFDRAYGMSLDAALAGCGNFIEGCGRGWDEAARNSPVEFPRPKPVKGYDDLKSYRTKLKKVLDKYTAVFTDSSGEHFEDLRAIAPAVTALLNLIMEFDKAYATVKHDRGLVDFSDLEHMVLKLLLGDARTGEKTEFAREIGGRFKEIMVDEYQDINGVQELIFEAISCDGQNLFMVGDVKQSIYRFRLADPSIFLSKYNKAVPAEDAESGAVKKDSQTALVLLKNNFRCRAGIVDFVNHIFTKIMSEEFGHMDYCERERLTAGRPPEDAGGSDVELNIIDMDTADCDEDGESLKSAQVEARFIASRISELVNGEHFIPGGDGEKRRIRYSDIVILMRAVTGKAWQYAAALSEYNIPAETPAGEGFFNTLEVSAALSLLRVIDNPMQDIPLAASLRSIAYGFTADELAEIRMKSPDTDYYSALVKASAADDKCAGFLDDIAALRLRAGDMPVYRFIWYMYGKTGLYGRAGALRGGAKRRGNLLFLADCARRFEQNGYRGLFGFLTYITGLQENGIELTPGDGGTADSRDAVRIMTIHKSKGLEFPVVILADTSKQFNTQDERKPLVMHTSLGLGISRIDRQRGIEYPTVSQTAVRGRLRSEMLAEEMRVLYVAMTRAREKLIITAAMKNSGGIWSDSEFRQTELSEKLPISLLEGIKNMAGWILASLRPDDMEKHSAWEMRVIPASAYSGTKSEAGRGADTGREKDDTHWDEETLARDVQRLRARFSFEYPYAGSTELPSKITVTELKEWRANTDGEEEPKALRLTRQAAAGVEPYFRRPEFIKEKTGMTPAERGTATHQVMQYLELSKCTGQAGVEDEIGRLVECGYISQETAGAVETVKIARFFESELGKRVRNAAVIRREFRFSLLVPACRLAEHLSGGDKSGGGIAEDDRVLIQGVVDCVFEEDGELVIVDFKTDRVTSESIEERTEYYTPQLTAYADALRRIMGKPVKECTVYFFAAGEARSV